MNQKEILITTDALSSVGHGGGVASYTHDLAENLAEAGHNVTVFLTQHFADTIPQNVSYVYKYFDFAETLIEEDTLVQKLLGEIELLKPEVIINNCTSYLAGLWPVLEEDIVKISVMHAFSKTYSYLVLGIIGKMATVNHEYLDYIICQNSLMVKNVSRRYNVPLEKLIFIPQTASHIDLALKPKSDVFTIIYAGGQRKQKGAREMFKIAKLLQESSLNFKVKWCVEAPKYKQAFENDNRFEFLGTLSREDFLNTLESADCIVVPTHMETGPLLLGEAMARGVIPICNNLKESAIPDLIEHGKNGILLDANNPKKYYQEIEKLIHNTKYREELRNKAYNYFINNLTSAEQTKKFEALFEKKTSFKKKEIFSDRHIIYDYRNRVLNQSKKYFQRVRSKLTNALEFPRFKEE